MVVGVVILHAYLFSSQQISCRLLVCYSQQPVFEKERESTEDLVHGDGPSVSFDLTNTILSLLSISGMQLV